MSDPSTSPFVPIGMPPAMTPGPRTAESRDDHPPVRANELVAVLAWVVLSDLTIYRGHGFAGYAALFLASPLLLVLGAYRSRLGRVAWLTGCFLMLLAAKLFWCGSPFLVLSSMRHLHETVR